ncbi:hypothetical protein B5S29_g2320 [[Candida] boidinii]|nr:hypothetical protein B5S29_g2320 [[Candida] boidinii]
MSSIFVNAIVQAVIYAIFSVTTFRDLIIYSSKAINFDVYQRRYLLYIILILLILCATRIGCSVIMIVSNFNGYSIPLYSAVTALEFVGNGILLLLFLVILWLLLPTDLSSDWFRFPIISGFILTSITFILVIVAAILYDWKTSILRSSPYGGVITRTIYGYNSACANLYFASSIIYVFCFTLIAIQSLINFIFAEKSTVTSSHSLIAFTIFPSLIFLLLRTIFSILSTSNGNIYFSYWTIAGKTSYFIGMELFPEIMIFLSVHAFLLIMFDNRYLESLGLDRFMKKRGYILSTNQMDAHYTSYDNSENYRYSSGVSEQSINEQPEIISDKNSGEFYENKQIPPYEEVKPSY